MHRHQSNIKHTWKNEEQRGAREGPREDTVLLRAQVWFQAQLYGLRLQSPNNHILSLLSNISTKQMQTQLKQVLQGEACDAKRLPTVSRGLDLGRENTTEEMTVQLRDEGTVIKNKQTKTRKEHLGKGKSTTKEPWGGGGGGKGVVSPEV